MANLPKPRIAVVDTDVPNAFATGRNPKHAAVAVTTGLWRRLEPQEVEGVLAHELSHIANRDVLVMTIASFFAMLAALLTRFGLYAGMFGGFGGGNRDSNNNQVPVWLIIFLVSVVVYAISFILIRTISRYREYAADRGSAIMTGAPENLMSALQKISSGITTSKMREGAAERVLHQSIDELERRTSERDWGLSLRRCSTSGLLGLLDVVFAVVLFSVLNVGLVAMLVIVIGLAVFAVLLRRSSRSPPRAPRSSRREGADLHAMVSGSARWPTCRSRGSQWSPTDVPNAFATGRNPKHAAVAVTTGLWRRLEPQEIEAVLAHELSHVANRDVLIMTLASFFAHARRADHALRASTPGCSAASAAATRTTATTTRCRSG